MSKLAISIIVLILFIGTAGASDPSRATGSMGGGLPNNPLIDDIKNSLQALSITISTLLKPAVIFEYNQRGYISGEPVTINWANDGGASVNFDNYGAITFNSNGFGENDIISVQLQKEYNRYFCSTSSCGGFSNWVSQYGTITLKNIPTLTPTLTPTPTPTPTSCTPGEKRGGGNKIYTCRFDGSGWDYTFIPSPPTPTTPVQTPYNTPMFNSILPIIGLFITAYLVLRQKPPKETKRSNKLC